MRLSRNRVLARDRRNAAMHEAAHYVIAGAVGLRSRGAWIAQIGDGTDINERGFVGQCVHPAGAKGRLSHMRRMMLGIAGAVGETLWRERGTFCIEDCLEDENWMSITDWHTTGAMPSDYPTKLVRAGYRVLDLLQGKLHGEWLGDARTLLRTGELYVAGDQMVADEVRTRRMRAASPPS